MRNAEKGEQAAARMTGDVTVQALDLTSPDSFRTAAAALRSRLDQPDLLINNAGVVYSQKQQTTKDGFEKVVRHQPPRPRRADRAAAAGRDAAGEGTPSGRVDAPHSAGI